MDAARRTLLPVLLAAQLIAPVDAQAQPTLNTPEQGSAEVQPDRLVEALGPWAGLVYDLTYGPGPEGFDAYALTQNGVYRYRSAQATWVHEVILPPEGPLGSPPFEVDMIHLVDKARAHAGFYDPQSVSLQVTEREFVVLAQDKVLHRARRGARWAADRLPKETAFGPGQRVPMRVSVSLGRPDIEQIFVLQADHDLDADVEKSRLWQKDSSARRWASQDWEGRTVLVREGRGVGPTWRYEGMTPETKAGVQVDRFLRPRWTQGESLRFQEIEWAKLLGASSDALSERCGGATGMMEATTSAGFEEPPIMIAVGPRTLCVSTDGGTRFSVRDGLLKTEGSLEKIGDLISAVAFPFEKAPAGVRMLVGTDEIFNPEAPTGRAFGGRLFLSDDAGQSWRDVTPDIEGPGAFIGLAAGPRREDRAVWLLTARRGLYKGEEGLGFSRASTGISSHPIHALAADPIFTKDVWAASPTGLYKRSGTWARTDVVSTRSLGTWPANEVQKGQLWVGTYRGSVLVRHQSGRSSKEHLPEIPPDEAMEITTTRGSLPRPVTMATGVRPVIMVVPTGLDADQRDLGYAIERDAGLFIREPAPLELVAAKDPSVEEGGMRWRHLPVPMPAPVNVQAMVAAPLGDHRFGALVFVTEARSDGAVGVAWLHDPTTGWTRADLPDRGVAKDAVLTPQGVWLSTMTGKLMPVETRGGRITFKTPLKGENFCDLLTMRMDKKLACVSSPLIGGPGKPGVKTARPIARATVIPLEALEPGADLGDRVERWLYEAANPLGQSFPEPLTVTFSHIEDVGEHAWISTGLAVYTRPVAFDGVLPPELSEGSPSAVLWVAPLVIAAAVIAAGFFVLAWLRRRRSGRVVGEEISVS